MQTRTSPVTVIAARAIESAVLLIGELNDQHATGRSPDGSLFARLRAETEALPLDLAQICFYRNTVSDCETLSAVGEPLVARLRMVQVARKLRTFRDRW